MLGKRLAVSIPDTVLEEKDSLRDKTVKLGTIARACAIYGVDIVEVFRDEKGRGEGQLIKRVLDYLETPQYLRRRLFPLEEALKFAGLLPPLRIPSHKGRVDLDELKVGEVREGVMNDDGTVDVGLEAAPVIKSGSKPGTRVTVRVVTLKPFVAEEVRRDAIGQYWGYRVESKSVGEVLTDRRFPLRVATSRLGDPLQRRVSDLRSALSGKAGVKLVFGSPSRGLFDIVGDGLEREVDFILNLFADQHVETVRTEEAVFVGLGLVNTLLAEKA